MPKFDKPDSPNIIWGVNALEGDLTKPDDSYIQTGWTQVKPPYEYENYSMNKLYQGFAYYNQLGFPEWDSVTEYQANQSYVQGSNNRVYKCIQTHSNRNPATAGNEAWWELFEGNRQATTASRGTVELATNDETFSGLSDVLAISPAALLNGFAGTVNATTKGHIKIPFNLNGARKDFIIQWGISVPLNTTSYTNTTLDIPFSTVFLGAVASHIGTTMDTSAFKVRGPTSLSQIGILSSLNSASAFYIAVGY